MVYAETLVSQFPIVSHDVGARFYDLSQDISAFKELTFVPEATIARVTIPLFSPLATPLHRVLECQKGFLSKLNQDITTPLSQFHRSCEKKRAELADEVQQHTAELLATEASLLSKREACMVAYRAAVESKDTASLPALAEMIADFESLSANSRKQHEDISWAQAPAILAELENLERLRLQTVQEMSGVFLNALNEFRGQVTALYQSSLAQHQSTPSSDELIKDFASEMAKRERITQVLPLPVTAEAVRGGDLTPINPAADVQLETDVTKPLVSSRSPSNPARKPPGPPSKPSIVQESPAKASRRISESPAKHSRKISEASAKHSRKISEVPVKPSRRISASRVPVGEGESADVSKNISNSTRQVFDALDIEGLESVSSTYLLSLLEQNGLLRNDPRLKALMEELEALGGAKEHVALSLSDFDTVISSCPILVQRCLSGQLRIPDFSMVAGHLKEIYEKVLPDTSGHVADYIPQLAKVNPDQFGISITTVDGQHFAIGDSDVSFSIQSCSKPISYLLALEQWGADYVHRHVGFEPSGKRFNEMVLKELEAKDGPKMIPHNPMINSGAIMTVSMIMPQLKSKERLEKVIEAWRAISGGAEESHAAVGFDEATYLSESGSADRNWCLGYMMKEKRAFPPCFTSLSETLELYFQCCSITSTNRAMSMMAATLANGGVNPRSGKRVFSAANVRRVLPLMMSAGLYDYSGQWAYEIGVPAKSGVGGCMFLVIPNVCGISIWSPRLDPIGNSARAVHVANELLGTFRLHTFEVFSQLSTKIDPIVAKNARRIGLWTELSLAASNGDATSLEVAWKEGVDLYGSDYDSRSLLHIVASEGHAEALAVLIAHAPDIDVINARDRFGSMPLDDARRGSHDACITLLEKAGAVASGVVYPLTNEFDNLVSSAQSLQVIFAAADGDLDELVRLAAAGADLVAADYDGRTALHLAHANGHRRCLDYLITRCSRDLKKLSKTYDRWGNCALPEYVKLPESSAQNPKDYVPKITFQRMASYRASYNA